MQNPEYQFISTKFHLVGSMAALAEWAPLKSFSIIDIFRSKSYPIMPISQGSIQFLLKIKNKNSTENGVRPTNFLQLVKI
jgi:hypothetical protein